MRPIHTLAQLAILSLVPAAALAQVDQPPAVTAPAAYLAAEGASFEVAVTATDPDGDPITSLTAAPLPTGAAFTTTAGNTSGTFSWTPTYQQAGSYPVQFTAVNGQTGAATTTIEVAETRTHANNPTAAMLFFGVSAATGELSVAYPPNPCLGGPMPLGFGVHYASLLGRTASYQGTLGENWRSNFDWRLTATPSTAVVEDAQGRTYSFTSVGGGWSLTEPTDLPHQLVALGPELVFKDGETLFLYYFDPGTGRLMKIEDLPGNRHTLAYDALTGRLDHVSDAFGRTLSLTYDRSGGLESVSDGTRRASFSYSGSLLLSYTNTAGETVHFAYDTLHPVPGLLTEIQDPAGTTPLRYSYDAAGRVVEVTNAKSATFTIDYLDASETEVTCSAGGVESFQHDRSSRLSERVDAAGGISTWAYDPSGRVTGATGPGGGSLLQTAYDPVGGYPSVLTYPGGAQVQFAYMARSRVPGIVWYLLSTQTAPDLTTVQIEYDTTGRIWRVVDEASHAWAYIRNAQGQPTQVTNPAGGVVTYGYDLAGRLASRTIGTDVTTYSYDAFDRLITVLYPDLSTRTFTYDNANRLLTATNELSKTWTRTYRPNGQIESLTDPLLQTTSYGYDNMNWLTSVTDALGHAETYEYDPLGRRTSRTDRTGRIWTRSYDLLGRLATTADPDMNVTVRGWDPRSRLTSIIGPLGRTVAFTYDGRDRLLTATDPLSRVTRYTFDDRDRLTTIAAPLSHTTRFGYEPRGLLMSVQVGSISGEFAYSPLRRLTTITDGNGNDWLRGHDNRGRLTSLTDPLGRSESFTYDSRDRIEGLTTVLGNGSFDWDAAGRMTLRSYSDGTVHNYSYDDNGRLLTTEGVVRAYDALGRLTQENGITFGYDDASRLTSQTFGPGLTLNYSHDTRGLLGRITDWNSKVTEFQYDAAGRRALLLRPDGTTTEYTYDLADRLTRWTVSRGESMATTTVHRDELGRVKVRFPWVAGGATPVPPITTATRSYDVASQVVGFSYDAMGRLLQDDLRAYTWDLGSRLTSVTEGGRTKTFRYDGLDRAFENTVGTVVTGYEYGVSGDFQGFMEGSPAQGPPLAHELAHVIQQSSGPAGRPYCCGDFVYDGGDTGTHETGGGTGTHEVGHWLGITPHGAPSGGGDIGTHEVGHWLGILPGAAPKGCGDIGTHEVGHWLGIAPDGVPSGGGDIGTHEVGHWLGILPHTAPQMDGAILVVSAADGPMPWTYHPHEFQGFMEGGGRSSSPLQLYFAGKLKVNGNTTAHTVGGPKDQLLYTIGQLNGQNVHHHADDLGNVSFLTNDAGAMTTNFAYSPTGEVRQHGWTPPDLRTTYRGSAGVIEESSSGLYRIGTGLYDAPTGRALPARLKITPPSSAAGTRLYVGNLSWNTSNSETGDGTLFAAPPARSMPASREHVLLGRQVGMAAAGAPSADGSAMGRYYITGARHVYMPAGDGFRIPFALGTAPPPQTAGPTGWSSFYRSF